MLSFKLMMPLLALLLISSVNAEASSPITSSIATNSPTKSPTKTESPTSPTESPTKSPTTQNNGTTSGEYSKATGFVSCGIAMLFFGSNFAPVKKYETGDGMFFQWVLCSAIFAVGVMVHAYKGWPTFQPEAMLGGALWATGNVMCVPCIQMIGMSVGLLIWGATNMLMGWFTGRFGLFGLTPDTLTNPNLNTVAVVLTLVSLSMYVFIKPSESDEEDPYEDGMEPLWDTAYDDEDHIQDATEDGGKAFYDKLPKTTRRAVGVLFAVISGLFYGSSFTPPYWVKDNGPSCVNSDKPGCGDQEMLDYVFPHYTGIFLTSTFYFLVYCAVTKNKPKIYPQVILPGYISGLMWGVANTSWFIANSALGFAVAFPLITSGPGFVAALWGVFVFGEIRGKKNFSILCVAFCFTVASGVCVAFSKK